MSSESAASRASQIARQIMLYGRPVAMEELVDRLANITTARLSDLAGRLFSTRPTVAAIGPIAKLASYERIQNLLMNAGQPPRKIAV